MELAPVFLVASHVVPPRLDSAGDTFDHPHADFRDRTGRPARPVGCHAFRTELIPTAQPVNPFAGITVFLESSVLPRSQRSKPVIGPPLLIEHDDVGAPAKLFHVPEAGGGLNEIAAQHAAPDAVGSTCGFGRAGKQIPNFQAALVAPFNPLPIGWIVPVLPGG